MALPALRLPEGLRDFIPGTRLYFDLLEQLGYSEEINIILRTDGHKLIIQSAWQWTPSTTPYRSRCQRSGAGTKTYANGHNPYFDSGHCCAACKMRSIRMVVSLTLYTIM